MSREDTITRELREIASAVAGDAARYLEEFLAATAWSALSVLELAERGEPVESALAELEEQTRVVLETIAELADQAQRRALLRAITASARLIVAAAAP
jgi:hypothetical protein